jgi:hypothetical protein
LLIVHRFRGGGKRSPHPARKESGHGQISWTMAYYAVMNELHSPWPHSSLFPPLPAETRLFDDPEDDEADDEDREDENEEDDEDEDDDNDDGEDGYSE